MDSKETMRLHMNNANLHIRTVLQLSVGVKNVTLQEATQSYLIACLHQRETNVTRLQFFVADYAYNRFALEAYFHVQVPREISADCSQTTKLSTMIYDDVVDAIVICRVYLVPLS